MKHWRSQLLAASFAFAANTAFAEGEIPQMDQSWYPNQLLWLAISFVLLYVVVSRFIAPSISGVLATRENAIASAIAEAERAKNEAESTRGSSTSESQSARAKAAEIMARVQAENSRDAATEISKLDRELTNRANHAAAVIDDVVAKAQAGVEAAADSLAETMVAHLLHQQDSAVDSTGPKLKLAKR